MAALLSRSTLGLQQCSRFALSGPSRLVIRGYAVVTTSTKPKPKPKPKAASPKTTPTPKSPASVTPISKAAAKKPATKPATRSSAKKAQQPRVLKSNGKLMAKFPEKNIRDMSEEEQLQQMEKVMAMSQFTPTRDVWGHKMETLDVMIPYSISFSQRSSYSSWQEMFEQFKQNSRNAMKNYMSMLTLASDNAIPGIDLSGDRWWHKFIMRWPWRLASTTSVADKSWLEPLRKSAFHTYCELNTAFAKGDDQTIKALTLGAYQDEALQLRKKKKRFCKYIWHLHKEVTPARVLSIRAAPGYLAIDPPKFGTRHAVQALVRIDTEQSLEIFTDEGLSLHNTNGSRDKHPSTAEPKRITEYLVFEKKMWYDGPWIIREQLWEAPGRKALKGIILN